MKLNKIYTYLAAAAALLGAASCDTPQEPVMHKPTAFSIDVPPAAGQSYELKNGEVLSIPASQPDYGIVTPVSYTAEISLTEDFEKSMPIANNNGSGNTVGLPDSEIAADICEMLGITDKTAWDAYADNPYTPLYVRVVAQVGTYDWTRIVSNVIKLPRVKFFFTQKAPDFVWMAGSGVNGTNWNNGQFAKVLWTENHTDYIGYANLTGDPQPEFKFSPTDAWSGDFGVKKDLVFETDSKGIVSAEGKADGGSNIKVPADGLYYIKLNYSTRVVSITGIKTIGVIGDFNNWSESVALTPSADRLTWTGTVSMQGGNSWKFRANDGWDINLGGTPDKLTGFGDPANLVCSESGTYTITLHLADIPYTATVEKQ